MGADLQPGTEVGSYRIEAAIGRGGMGVVYRAQDLRLGRSVALKVLAPERAADEAFRDRFTRESRILASLDDPHIVPIFDAGEVDGRLYIAMRLVPGPDLRTVLDGGGAIEPARAVEIVAQLADALDAAHARGLIHRDVKPANVLLSPGAGRSATDHVYLSDFGLTKQASSESGLTAIGSFLGTPGYVAPEQIEGKALDHRVDVYALGCVLYSCLTGQLVYPRDSTIASLWAHLQEPPPRPSVARSGVPVDFDAVIEKAMARDPDLRYQTCGGLAAAARVALDSEPGATGAIVTAGLADPSTMIESRDLPIAAAAGSGAVPDAPDTRTVIESIIVPIPFAAGATVLEQGTVTGIEPPALAAGDDDVAGTDHVVAAATIFDGTDPTGSAHATTVGREVATALAHEPAVTDIAPAAAVTVLGAGVGTATQIDRDAPTAPVAFAAPGGSGGRRAYPPRRRTIIIAAAGLAALIGTSGLALALGVGGGGGPSPSPSAVGGAVVEPSGSPTPAPVVSAPPTPTPTLSTDAPGVPQVATPTPSPSSSPTQKPTLTPDPTAKPDTTRPTGSVKINGGDKYSGSRTVKLSLSAKDDRKVTRVAISNGTSLSGARKYDYVRAKSWTLSSKIGKRTVSVWYYDGRNWSKRYADTIIYDHAPKTPDVYFNMKSSTHGSQFCSTYVTFKIGRDFASDPDGNGTLKLIKATNVGGTIVYDINADGVSIRFYLGEQGAVTREAFIYTVRDSWGRQGSGQVTWDYGPCPPA